MATSRRGRRRTRRRSQSKSLHNPSARSLRYEPLEDRRLLAVVTVDTDQDVVDFTDGVTSLREAVFATNLVAGADEIQFDFGHDGPATILLTQGELAITDSVEIIGLGAELLTIDASGNDPTPDSTPLDDNDDDDGDGSRIFNIDDGDSFVSINVELRGLTLTGGDEDGDGGAVLSQETLFVVGSAISANSAGGDGGGIWALGTTTVTDNTISHNLARSGAGIWTKGTATITGSAISGNSAGRGGGIFAFGTTTISGSTISGNSADNLGGGLYAGILTTTTITDSSISDNSAAGFGGGLHAGLLTTTTITGSTISDNAAGVNGGGIFAFFAATSVITDSVISGNSAGESGGGIYARFRLEIVDSFVSGNFAGKDGGGIWADGTTTIGGSTISGNSASFGGGIAANGTTEISNSNISGNVAMRAGGGVWTKGATTITDSTISNNSAGIASAGSTTSISGIADASSHATGSDQGGGIWFLGRAISILGSTISGNSSAGDGGGVLARAGVATKIIDSTISGNSSGKNGGGIIFVKYLSANSTITGSTISGNTAAGEGGGAFSTGQGDLMIAHSTITENHSDADNNGVGSGGGSFADSGTVFLDHTIVAGNGRGSNLTTLDDIAGQNSAVFNADFSLIQALSPGTLLLANSTLIGFDPMLASLADNGGRTLTHALLPGSPAINAGDPGAVPGVDGVPVFDQRGIPFTRVHGGRIDIGAFESQPLPGDFDGDGDTDGNDLAQWEGDFGLNGDSDTDGDGDSDGADFMNWQRTYGVALPPVAPLAQHVEDDLPALRAEAVDLALAMMLALDTPRPQRPLLEADNSPESSAHLDVAFESLQRTTETLLRTDDRLVEVLQRRPTVEEEETLDLIDDALAVDHLFARL